GERRAGGGHGIVVQRDHARGERGARVLSSGGISMAPPYVRRGGMDVQPAPWRCEQMLHAYIFGIKARKASLQALCKRCLNDPSGGKLQYEPVLRLLGQHYVALTFQHFPGLYPDPHAAPNALPVNQKGRHHYNEASFWVMVKDGDRPLEMFIP